MFRLCLLLLAASHCVRGAPSIERKDDFKLTILHNNDLHGRFDQVDVNADVCTSALASSEMCYGGFARTAHLIREYRAKSLNPDAPAVLYLNAGDIFTGTVWSQVFKDKISADLMNFLLPNATTLGNHEFDFGTKTLEALIANSQFPYVVSNLDLSNEPKLASLSKLVKSLVLNVNGRKVGIVGYVTPETVLQSSTGRVLITPEIEAVNREATKLKEAGVDIIIAVAHSGFEQDKLIARSCPDLDIIIGGHTNTFLYNNKVPDKEQAEGPYPVVVHQDNGRTVLVVQAYAYTKYLGVLNVNFDSHGKVTEWNGNPILIDSSIPQDKDVLEALEKYRPNITALSVEVGHTKVFLNGTKEGCRRGECNLGNMVTDAMLYARQKDLADEGKEQDTFIALVSAGGIKKSISNTSNDGQILLEDILTAYPYKNVLYIAKIRGDYLLNGLRHSADSYDAEENGGYLQFAGLEVVYDMTKPKGQRVVKVDAKISAKSLQPIQMERIYNVVLGEFLTKGGDGYRWSEAADGHADAEFMKWTDSSAIIEYLSVASPLTKDLEGRQTVIS